MISRARHAAARSRTRTRPRTPVGARGAVPAVLAVLGVVAVACAVADVRTGALHDLRAAATPTFLLLGPGWAVAAFVVGPGDSVARRWVLAVGVGAALTVLGGQAMVVSGAWHPVGLLYATAALTVPVLGAHAARAREERP